MFLGDNEEETFARRGNHMKQNLRSVADLTAALLIFAATPMIFHSEPQTAQAQLAVKIKVPKVNSPKPQPSPTDSGQPGSTTPIDTQPPTGNRNAGTTSGGAVRAQTCAA
jgi:hypothetical protein